jgi:hypothetical protein
VACCCQSDYKRGKRAHKLAKLMLKKQAQEPLQTFASRIKLLIFILLAVHIASFVIINTELSNLYEYAPQLLSVCTPCHAAISATVLLELRVPG